jgi:hypothetical protein
VEEILCRNASALDRPVEGRMETFMSTLEMLSLQNCAIVLIDYQPAIYQGVRSHDRLSTFNTFKCVPWPLSGTVSILGVSCHIAGSSIAGGVVSPNCGCRSRNMASK